MLLESHDIVPKMIVLAHAPGRGPEEGNQRSRSNPVRHGLTAETVIAALEDAGDYKAFEAAITADYDAQSAVDRELVIQVASLLWRLRRVTTIETGLFEIQADHLGDLTKERQVAPVSRQILYALLGHASVVRPDHEQRHLARPSNLKQCTRWIRQHPSRWSIPLLTCALLFAARQSAEFGARPSQPL
jgi:hypothetical protein